MTTIRILGSCSGTEPMPGRAHTSLAFTVGDRLYFFDAGGSCSRAAHLAGLDALKTRAIFISHTHYDHIGGLAGLFWLMTKLSSVTGRPVADGEVKLLIPDLEVWESVKNMLVNTDSSFTKNYKVTVGTPQLGKFYEDENIRVSAFPSYHLPDGADGRCRSFSYRIEMEGKVVVFSGDVRSPQDLASVVGDGCDILLCETGHHPVKSVCDFAESHPVGHLIFTHHGREVLYEKPSVNEAVQTCKIPVALSFDGFEIQV